MFKSFNLFILFLLIVKLSAAQESTSSKQDSLPKQKNWSVHFQTTIVDQYHGKHHFPYAGPSSLDSNSEKALSTTTTLFLARRLWQNAAVYFSPEITGGNGFSGTRGLAGFTNGEIYRVGDPTPTPFIARAYFQQTFPLKGSTYSPQADDALQLQGALPTSRLTVNIGKFCLADFFDDNGYSHDARSQFLNWSIMANGAWDFAADTRGYTSGAEVELVKPAYAIRFAITQMPVKANGLDMNWNFFKSNAIALEFAAPYKLLSMPGIIRITGFRNSGRAPKYSDATKALLQGDSTYLRIIDGSALGLKYGGVKYGYGINIEQPLSKTLSAFLRYGWNDGRTASWAFTDIDQNIQLGVNIAGSLWNRPDDALGIAAATNGLSKEHRAYLEAGGYSFIIGDGHLKYGREQIFETYYRAKLSSILFVSADYQLALNPGYNKDRKGPISVPGIRVHIEF